MVGSSEFDTKPRMMIMHHPGKSAALRTVTSSELEKYNFTSLPDVDVLCTEYDRFIAKMRELGLEVTELLDIVSDTTDDTNGGALASPNTMFTRDSAVTLPWQPDVFIASNFTLHSRATESETMKKALNYLGLTEIKVLTPECFLEGGDVIGIIHNQRRILLVGWGSRTNELALEALARQLIPEYADVVVGIKHPDSILHLDTGFTVLPRQTVVTAPSMLSGGLVFGYGKKAQPIDVANYLTTLGFTILTAPYDGQDAYHELCNMVPIGDNNYISFPLPYEFKKQLEESAYIWIHEIEGAEILKTAGGLHCLTRPVY